MSEEEIIQTLENMIKSWNNIREDCKNSDLSKQIEQIEKENKAIQGLLDLYNKQKEEIEIHKETENDYEYEIKRYEEQIEKLKTDKKNASEYIREEMYVDENPTLDDDNTITELPISLSLCNEDLRKLLELLEENK